MNRSISTLFIAIMALTMGFIPALADWGIQAEPHVCYISYKEALPSHLKSEESGMVPGMGIQVRLASEETAWVSNVQFMSGEMQYDGTTQSGTPVTASKYNQFIHLETALNSGIARLGLGSDIWNRDLIDYREVYTRNYAIVGLSIPITDGDIGSIIDLSATVPFQSQMDLSLPVNNQVNKIGFTLENQIGWKVALPVIIKNGHTPISISPYAEWYGFGASEVNRVQLATTQSVVNLQEPSSSTFKVGIAVSVKF